MKSTYTTRRAVFSRIALLVLLTATLRAHADRTHLDKGCGWLGAGHHRA